MNFGVLSYHKAKILLDLSDNNGALVHLSTAKRIFSENVDNEQGGDFAAVRLASILKEIAASHAAKDEFQSALKTYQEAFSMFKKIYPDELYRGISATYNDLSNICISFKKFDLAQEYIDRAMLINRKLFGESNLELSTNYHTLGYLLSKKHE